MKNIVYFYNKKSNFIINNLRFIILIGIVIWGIFKFDNIKILILQLLDLKGLSDFQLDIIVVLFESFVTFLIGIIIKYTKNFFSINSYVKHKLYPFLRTSFGGLRHKMGRIVGNKSINIFFHTNYKPTFDQSNVSKIILEFLSKNRDENAIFWLQGETFSGKTMTISNILIKFISQKKYYNAFKTFDDKIIYIDLLHDELEPFLKKYRKLKYSKNFLIIDNIYLLSEHDLIVLLNTISSDVSARVIVVCMREFHELTNDSYIAKKLNLTINVVGEHILIPKVKLDFFDLEKSLLKSKHNFNSILEMNESTQIHYINMFEQIRKYSNKISNSNNALFNDINDYIENHLSINNYTHKIIIAISTLCLFTGSFKRSQLLEFFSGFKNRIMLENVLSELHSYGFIARSPYGFGEAFILNSQVAKSYFEIGYINKSCRNIIYKILEQQYNFYKKRNNFYLAFLYGCFIVDKLYEQRITFNSIAININFKMFLQEMIYLQSVEQNIKSNYRRELGILYDRTGEILKSRREFKDLLNDAINNGEMELAAECFYRLVQSDHTEYNNYTYLKNYEPMDLYLKIQKKYWKLHINMHKGKFLLVELIGLLNDAKEICNNECTYDNLHLLRRIYFDVYRMYYLDGSMDSNSLLDIKNNGEYIERYLRNNLDEFSLYYKKFTVVFLLSKDVLFNLKLDKTVVDQNIFQEFLNNIDLKYTDMSDTQRILDTCINICIDLEDDFEKIGDKTFNFIRYYRTELLIIKNDASCKTLIKQYRDFGTEEIEYRLYAEFLELKYRISEYVNLENLERKSDENYEYNKRSVYEQLNIIKNMFSNYYNNDYALMRYRIYKLMLCIWERRKDLNSNFEKAFSLAKKNKYNRELKLLRILKDQNFKVTPGWCRDIMLYYPIVPQ